ncbi:MAG: nucleoside recognition domain-containing protein [Candidatus Merdivicinus sp.]|jgi:spore maturation protein A
MNTILPLLALFALIAGIFSGKMEVVSGAAIQRCADAVPLVLSLTGMLCLWSGLMEIAERSGLTKKIAALFRPLTSLLFPALRKDAEVCGLIAMNITANLLGLGNAATPLGLAAMSRLPVLPDGSASREAITLVVLNTCSIQLIPATTAAIRLAMGSNSPMEILIPTLAASALALIVSLTLVFICAHIFPDQRKCR